MLAMRRTAFLFIAVLVLLSALAEPARAQAARDDAAAALQKEVAQLNRSMEQIVALLRENIETQRLEILLKRVELSRLDLAPLQNELRSLRSEQGALQGEHDQIRSRLDEIEEQIAVQQEEVPQPPVSEDLLNARREYEARLKFLKSRLQDIEARILELDNDLSSRRRQIESLEGMVDERLGLRR